MDLVLSHLAARNCIPGDLAHEPMAKIVHDSCEPPAERHGFAAPATPRCSPVNSKFFVSRDIDLGAFVAPSRAKTGIYDATFVASCPSRVAMMSRVIEN